MAATAEQVANTTRTAFKSGERNQFAGGEFQYADTLHGGLDIQGWANTNELNRYDVIVEPTAFTRKVLKEFKESPLMLWMHNPEEPIGKWNIAKVDKNKGLWVEGHIEETRRGKDVMMCINAGIIKSLSIGFLDKTIEKDEDTGVTTITEMAHLYEISVVTRGVDKHALLQADRKYADAFERLTHTETQTNTTTERRGTMPKDAPHVLAGDEKEVVAIVDERLKAQEPVLAEYKSDIDTLKENVEAQNKLTKTYQDQAAKFNKGVITKDDLTAYEEKMGKEMVALSDKIEKSINAVALQDRKNSTCYSGWRDIVQDFDHLTDAQGAPLNEMDKKAYALLQAPLNTDMKDAHILQAIRDCSDAVIYCDAYNSAVGARNFHITQLRCYQNMKKLIHTYFDQEFASAMAGGNATAGAEWLPSYLSDRLVEYARVEPTLANRFEHWDMRSRIEKWPLLTGAATVTRAPERLVANAAQYAKTYVSTADATFTAQDFIGIIPLSTDLIEDSIIAIAPMITKALALAHVEAMEAAIVNGDTTGTHRDTTNSWGSSDVETAFMGLRYHSIDVSGHMIVGGAAVVDFTAAKLRVLRGLMGPMALDVSKLFWAVNIKAYFHMMGFAQTSQPGTYGSQATWLSGTLSNFDGIPIVLTSKISEDLSDNGLDTGADGTDMSGILLVHAPSFKIGHRRGITVEAEKQATVQQVFVVASQRASFQKIAKSTDIPVAYGYQIWTV